MKKPYILLFLCLLAVALAAPPAFGQAEPYQKSDDFGRYVSYAVLIILLISFYFTLKQNHRKPLLVPVPIGAVNREKPDEKKKDEGKDEFRPLPKRQIALAGALFGALALSFIFLVSNGFFRTALILLAAKAIVIFSCWETTVQIWQSFTHRTPLQVHDKAQTALIKEEEKKTTFKDVGGLDEEIEELKYVVYCFRNPEEVEERGIRPTKGILIVGPPGCGKTLLARAIAGEWGGKFFEYKGAAIGDKYMRTGAKDIEEIFAKARASAPCVVFIDEFDAIARRRGYDTSGELDHTLTAFLAEMDGIKPLNGVLVIVASNREDVLDEAAIRPGRFDKKFVISYPDASDRMRILQIHTAKKKIGEDVNFERLVHKTHGFSGAALENLCNQAAEIEHRRYIKEKEEKGMIAKAVEFAKELFVEPGITLADFEAAFDKTIMGSEKKLIMGKKEQWTTAVHEMGHAAVTIKKKLSILDKVTLVARNWGAFGATLSLEEETRLPSRAMLLARITAIFGGRAAEEVFFGTDNVTIGAQNDLERTDELVRLMVCEWGMGEMGPVFFQKIDPRLGGQQFSSEQMRAKRDAEIVGIKTDCYEEAKRIIIENKVIIEHLAGLLQEQTSLSGEEVMNIWREQNSKNIKYSQN